MPLLPAALLIFALASVLWFALDFAVTMQLISDGSMRDQAHITFGYIAAAVAAATVVGWLWALLASARSGSPVNGAVQIMCGATAVALLATALATEVLIGGRFWDEPTAYLIGHAAIAVLLEVQVDRSRKRSAPNTLPKP